MKTNSPQIHASKSLYITRRAVELQPEWFAGEHPLHKRKQHTIKEIFVSKLTEASFKGEPYRLSWPSCLQGTGSSFHFYKLKASWNVKSRMTNWEAARVISWFSERAWAILNAHTLTVLAHGKSWGCSGLLLFQKTARFLRPCFKVAEAHHVKHFMLGRLHCRF